MRPVLHIAFVWLVCATASGIARADLIEPDERAEAAAAVPSRAPAPPFEAYGNQSGHATAVDVVQDPLAPNWRIEQAARPDSTFEFALRMKRFRAGGDGEGRQVFHRRAADLVRDHGYSGYEVLRYEESLESAMLGSQRTIRGAIRRTGTLPG